jgi:hypothetical protein
VSVSPRVVRRRAARPGRAAARWLVVVAVVAAVGVMLRLSYGSVARARRASGARLGADAALVRGATRLARIERVVRARGRGRLPLYLAPASGPVVDSARVGVLAARLVPGTDLGTAPVIALVARDSVAGLAPVGRLVITPGEPGLLVFGAGGAGAVSGGRR